MGLVALLLSACGLGGSEPPGDDATAGTDAELEQVRSEAVDLARTLAPQVSQASGADLGPATGAYRSTGSSGTKSYYAFRARVELSGGTYDADAIGTVMRDADLEVTAYEDPNGDRVVQGRGDAISATARNRPGDSTIRLQVERSGALVDVGTAARRAELRRETPIDLG